MIDTDNETAGDLIEFKTLAETMVRVVSEEPAERSASGATETGESSVLMMVKKPFEDDERILCVRFNRWLVSRL